MYAAPSPDGAARGERGQASPDLIARAFGVAPVGLAVLDRDLRVLQANERLGLLVGGGRGLELGALARDPGSGVHSALEAVLRDGTPVLDQRLVVDAPGGGSRHLLADYVPLTDADGEAAGVVVSVSDVTSLADASHELAALGPRDRDGAALARLWAIEHVADVTLARLPVDDLLRELLARLRQAMRADTATVLLLDAERDVLVARGLLGARGGGAHDGVEVPVGHGTRGPHRADPGDRVGAGRPLRGRRQPAITAEVSSLLGVAPPRRRARPRGDPRRRTREPGRSTTTTGA
ncbi:MAG: PAS domain-containing protein [Thermoleophilia bacterium]